MDRWMEHTRMEGTRVETSGAGRANGVVSAMLLVAFAFLAAFSICVPSASAFGVSPARITLHEDGPQEFAFAPVFSSGEDGVVVVTAEGDLADSIRFEKTLLKDGDIVRGVVVRPADLEPGDHGQRIIMRFVPTSASGTIAANLEVTGLLIVNKPYPESYLRGDFSFSTDPGTNVVLVTVMLENVGSVSVTPDSAILEILDGESLRDAVVFEPVPVPPASFSKLTAEYLGISRQELSPGVYSATLRVPYGERSLLLEREFSLGNPALSVDAVVYNDESGAIKPVDVSGVLRWNKPLDATFTVYVDNGTEPVLVQTASISGRFDERLYLDTGRVAAPASSIEVVVTTGTASASGTASIDSVGASKDSRYRFIAAIIVLLVLVVVALLVWLLRPRRPAAVVPPVDGVHVTGTPPASSSLTESSRGGFASKQSDAVARAIDNQNDIIKDTSLSSDASLLSSEKEPNTDAGAVADEEKK